jgi:hypothetical protein
MHLKQCLLHRFTFKVFYCFIVLHMIYFEMCSMCTWEECCSTVVLVYCPVNVNNNEVIKSDVQIIYILTDFLWTYSTIDRKVLKFPNRIVVFSIFFYSVSFCFIHFESLLLGSCTFKVIESFWWTDYPLHHYQWSLYFWLHSLSFILYFLTLVSPAFLHLQRAC